MRFPLNLKRDHAEEVAHFEGNEHVHFFHQYYLSARRAGFDVRVLAPPYVPFVSWQPDVLALDDRARRVAYTVVRHAARRLRVTRRAYLAWMMLIAGDSSLNMICEK